MSDVTRILRKIEEGNPAAANDLLPLVYDELRRLAASHMAREAPDHTLQATGLVHEAYLRLAGVEGTRSYRDGRHFFAAAATAMRRILVDSARSRKTQKRGGDRQQVEVSDIAAPVRDDELLSLDSALIRLAEIDPVKAQVVELRYFAGMTGEQIAETLEISPSTVDRHWTFARAWLLAEVRGG